MPIWICVTLIQKKDCIILWLRFIRKQDRNFLSSRVWIIPHLGFRNYSHITAHIQKSNCWMGELKIKKLIKLILQIKLMVVVTVIICQMMVGIIEGEV